MEAARQRDRVDIAARPARDAQHLVDAEPRHRLAVALDAGQPLLGDRRDQIVVVERRRGGVVNAGVDRQNAHQPRAQAGGVSLARMMPR